MIFNEIKNSLFDSLSSKYGGAIFIQNSNIELNLCDCCFDSCITTGSIDSTNREKYPSGGACYIDINTINITGILSYNCKANGFGHTFYITLPSYHIAQIEFLSDSLTGKEVTPYSSIYAFDKGSFYTSNANITYPISITEAGTLCTGMKPSFIKNGYFHIIFKEDDTSTAFGFDVFEDTTSYSHYFHIENSKVSSDKGIFCFRYGSHVLDNFYKK